MSRGSGFVKLKTKEQAINAINAINNTYMAEVMYIFLIFLGRYIFQNTDKPIEVRFAVSKTQRMGKVQLLLLFLVHWFQAAFSARNPGQNHGSGVFSNQGWNELVPRLAPTHQEHGDNNVKSHVLLVFFYLSFQVRPHNGGWVEYMSSENRPYFFNVFTRQTQWQVPEEMICARPAPQVGGDFICFLFVIPGSFQSGNRPWLCTQAHCPQPCTQYSF